MADNAPCGREVHWAQLPIWMLAGLSWGLERVGGMPPPVALELAGRILMPLLGFLFQALVFLFLARRGRLSFAILVAVPMAVCTQYSFHTMRPDHHGFQMVFIVFALLCLLRGGMGWCGARSPEFPDNGLPSPRSARRHFVLAGISSGLGLWMGATVFAFALFALAAGVALSLLLARTQDGEQARAVLCPDLFRWWGVSGALTSLFFYLVEYAPSHFAMRLEVNHPLYALAFLGTAECLRAIARWKQDPASLGWKDGLPAIVGFGMAVALPAVLLLGPVEWFLPRTTIMLRLHARFIMEFHPLWETGTFWSFLGDSPILPVGGLAGFLSVALLGLKRVPFACQAALRLLIFMSLMFFLLSCWQVRWVQDLHFFLILLVAFAWMAFREDLRREPGRRVWFWGCLLVGLLALVSPIQAATSNLRSIVRLFRVENMDATWFKMMLQRNFLLQLKAATPEGRSLRAMLPMEMAPGAYYFGVGTGVGSLYWENVEGMTAIAEFFGDPLPGSRTYEIARERGITHVVVNRAQGEGDAYAFYNLLTGKSDYPGVADTVGYALALDESLESDWLRLDAPLTAIASRSYYVHLSGNGRWAPFQLPLRVYTLRP